LDRVAELRRLRRPVPEVQVLDEQQRHREHQRAEIPEASSVALVVDPAAEEAEHEEHRSQQRLSAGVVGMRVAQPLPLEVVPPHPDLPREGRLPFAELRLAVLTAIEVVHEAVVRLLTERARELETVLTRSGLTLVERREIRGANRLRRERSDSEHERGETGEQQSPPDQ